MTGRHAHRAVPAAVVAGDPFAGDRDLPANGRRSRRADRLVLAGGVLLLALLAVTQAALRDHWGQPGGIAIYLAANAAMVGTFLCLVCLVLVSRIPWLERTVGHDRMVLAHRRLAPLALILIVVHAELILVGYAQAEHRAPLSVGARLMTDPWMRAATVGAVLMVVLGLLSWRRARRSMRYERWWLGHLLFYLAIVLSFGHELVLGTLLREWPLVRAAWIATFAAVFAGLLWARLVYPAYLSWRHRLTVAAVVRESGTGVVSVWIAGRGLELLGAKGGQFFQWRFLCARWWWQSHPYSLSASPDGRYLRITVKAAGDHSRGLARLRPGTRVWAEGPYGVFTADTRHGSDVLAMAAGVGVTPVRAMLEDLPPHTRVTVLYRVPTEDHAPLGRELDALAAERGWTLHYLTGGPGSWPLDADLLRRLHPSVASADVYVCGPPGFMSAACEAATAAGVPEWRLHHEQFAFA